MKCQECGTTEESAEVQNVSNYWTCGGRNCFYFEWYKIENAKLPLCQDCESNQFTNCDHCGDFISYDCLFGAEEYDDDGEFLGRRCPGCKKIMEE